MSVYSSSFTHYILSSYREQTTRHTKRQKAKFESTEQTSEPDSDMAGMLERSDWEIKMTVIHMLRAPMNQGDSSTKLLPKVTQPPYTPTTLDEGPIVLHFY